MASGSRCIVLGGSGFLGQRLCSRLVKSGFRVTSVSRSGMPIGGAVGVLSEVEWIAAPLDSPAALHVLGDAAFVFHLASTTLPPSSNLDMVFDLESNAVATLRMLKASVANRVRRHIFVSSGGTVYGIPRQIPIAEGHPTEPICSYGIHKLVIEKYFSLFRSLGQLDSLIVRPSNIYGPTQPRSSPLGAVAHFTRNAIENLPIEIWGDGTTTRDYVYIEDVVDALILCISYVGPEFVFNIGTARGTSLNDLVKHIQQQLSHRVTVNYRPARNFDVPVNVLDNRRAAQTLGWTPRVSLETGIKKIIEGLTTASARSVQEGEIQSSSRT